MADSTENDHMVCGIGIAAVFTRERLENAARSVGQLLTCRHGRPVITIEMAEVLPPPFPPEHDLCRNEPSRNP